MESGSTPTVRDYYSDVYTPDIDSMKLQLQELVSQGTLSPEQAQAITLQKSNMDGVSTDPSLKNAQMDALLGLQDISNNGGMTDMDRANMARIGNQENTAARGQSDAILQNAQARGMGGSGMEMLARLQNQQASATRQAQRDMDVTGQARDRALQALMQGGATAGNIRSQDFNEQAQKATAADAIDKFNAQNRQNVNLTNTAANNQAQAQNLNNKQNLANANTTTANNQQQYNKQLIQQDYDNQIKKAAGHYGVAANNAAAVGANSQASANADNQMTGTMISAMAMMSDERCKEDVKEFNPSDFLDSLTSYKYRYKDPKHGEGEHVGVMAQDLEKTDMGSKMVSESPDGKVVDYAKAGPSVLASLASLNERLKKMEKGAE